jgi:F-type H+-transporting ATPase subunit a
MATHVWIDVHGWALRDSLLTSVALSAALALGAALLSRRLAKGREAAVPAAAEAIYTLMRDAVAEVVPEARIDAVLPFIGTLWLFILSSNLVGLVPGLSAPTRDLSVTAALAVIVFVAVHFYGVRQAGWAAYLRHYLAPSPLLLPFHLVSEVTRTLALAVRLFGNMMSLQMAAALVLLVAGLLVPVPLLLLHVIEALVQAYIFGMLALIYVGSALEVSSAHGGEASGAGNPSSARETP